MNLNHLYLGLAVAFNVSAYMVFKAIAARAHDATWAGLFALGLALGGINTYCFTAAMRQIQLATAYPLFAGASISLVVLLSVLVFGEPLRASHLAGALLVVAGIVLLTR